MNEHLPWIVAAIAAGGLTLNCIVQIRGGAWNAAERDGKLKDLLRTGMDDIAKSTKNSVDALRSETTQNLASINVDIEDARRESKEQHHDAMSKFGDTVAALREKVNLDALHAERTFMKREDFHIWSQTQKEALGILDRNVNERFNRIETLLLNRPWPMVAPGDHHPLPVQNKS